MIGAIEGGGHVRRDVSEACLFPSNSRLPAAYLSRLSMCVCVCMYVCTHTNTHTQRHTRIRKDTFAYATTGDTHTQRQVSADRVEAAKSSHQSKPRTRVCGA